MSPSRTPIPHHRNSSSTTSSIVASSTVNRRSTSSSSDLLQNKLRTLLYASSDTKESIGSSQLADLGLMTKFKSDSPSSYDINKYMSPKKLNQEVSYTVNIFLIFLNLNKKKICIFSVICTS